MAATPHSKPSRRRSVKGGGASLHKAKEISAGTGASPVAAPKQRNTENRARRDQGGPDSRGPDEEAGELRQKDRDARWAVKFSKAWPREDGAPQVDIAVPSYLAADGSEAGIPSKANRKEPKPHDPIAYKMRNIIERSFNRLKDWRAIATRYDKKAANFLVGVCLASAVTYWLQ